MLADSENDIGAPMFEELTSDTRLALTEAVTQGSCAAGLLLPDRHTDVARAEPIAGVAEVHRLAGRIGAEAVVRQLNSSKGNLCQQRLDRLELNRRSPFSTGLAGSRTAFGTRRKATVAHRSGVSTLKCTSESSFASCRPSRKGQREPDRHGIRDLVEDDDQQDEQARAPFIASAAPQWELAIPTTVIGQRQILMFPDPLRRVDELLILCHSSAIDESPLWERSNLALMLARPAEGAYQLFPQDRFNHAGLDYGYQWVTRVARDPASNRIYGDGIRISRVVLDDTLRWARVTGNHRRISTRHPIVVGGAAAAILDILATFVFRGLAAGVSPARVLQGIASGLLGPAAFQGGVATAALGLALHFVIAFSAAAVYFAASRILPILVRRAVIGGLAYGVAVHLFMNHVVLPLSRVRFRTPPWQFLAVVIAIHMLFVGLPIALAVRRGSRVS